MECARESVNGGRGGESREVERRVGALGVGMLRREEVERLRRKKESAMVEVGVTLRRRRGVWMVLGGKGVRGCSGLITGWDEISTSCLYQWEREGK